MKKYIKLVRVEHYTKNLFVFFPAFFASELNNSEVIFESLYAFLSFSFIASSIYIFNDWMDKEDDAKHKTKRFRPIASGEINSYQAFISMILMFLLSTSIAVNVEIQLLYIILLYFFLNILYSYKLKSIPIIDIFIISSGFVLRIFAGSSVSGIYISHWIVIMTFLLALFLALAKRRDDVISYEQSKIKTRSVVDGYNRVFIDLSIVMTSSIVFLTYLLWCVSSEVQSKLNSQYLYVTSFFVLLGIMRYMQITFVHEKSGNPTKILISDMYLQTIIGFWLLAFVIVLYI
tara:strand:+ start:5057 stop:5923 length:867 start_codon:yes stop_codon:yes gene_type:complete